MTVGAIGPIRGKTVLITGATSGIGLWTARALAAEGAHVVLVGRSADKTTAAAAEVAGVAAAGAQVHTLLADMASLASIRAACAEAAARFPVLDVLVNNAGAMHMERATTADGFEMTFGVNHLGYMETTLGLLPLLRAAPAARVVVVASDAHRMGKIDWDDLQSTRGYNGWSVYGTSKLQNILFTRALARRLAGTAISANSLHPGVVATGFGRNNDGWVGRLVALGAPFLISPARGARTSVYLAADAAVDGVTGRYFARCKEVKPRAHATDDDAAERLWAESLRLLGRTEPA